RWYDEEDLMTAAGQRMTEQLPADVLMRHDLAAVVLYLPQRLSDHAAALLRAAATLGHMAVLAGITGDRRADLEVVASVSRLDAERTASPPPAVDTTSD